MGQIIKKWLDFADGDLEAAESLYENPKSDRAWQLVVLHCHQAMEKMLKTIMVKQAKEVKKIHDLSRLLELVQVHIPEEFVDYINELNPHYQIPRYPDIPYRGPLLQYNQDIAQYHLIKTKKLFVWLKKHLLT